MGFALVCEEHVCSASPLSAPCLLCLSPSLKMKSKKRKKEESLCLCLCVQTWDVLRLSRLLSICLYEYA